MNRCAGTMSSLKSARLTSRLVSSRTIFSSVSVSDPAPKRCGSARSAASRAADSGSGTKRDRGLCGRLLSSAWILSLSIPGTSHSARSSVTWFSTNSGTVTVKPSRGSPGSCRYVAAQSTPPSRTTRGKASVVIPAASWRISSSRVSLSSPGLPRLASRYQRSSVAPPYTSRGMNLS